MEIAKKGFGGKCELMIGMSPGVPETKKHEANP
ncbi:hypothetical protein MCEMSE15_02586 [Fimbriimonadaceae bacterium]|jgi:hypothetical protein